LLKSHRKPGKLFTAENAECSREPRGVESQRTLRFSKETRAAETRRKGAAERRRCFRYTS
jgi:hypothetical protein